MIPLYVAALKPLPDDLESRQFAGVLDETDGLVRGSPLPLPDVLLIVEMDEAFYLLRYLSFGEEVGDTWHQAIEEAKDDADYEYEGCVGRWLEIPDGMTSEKEIIAFALSVGP